MSSDVPVSPPSSAPAGAFAPRRSKAPWIIAVVVLAAAGAGAAWYFKRRQDSSAVSVSVEKAIIKTITQIVSATGKVQPEVEVKIAPEVSGEVVKLGFREGAVVKKGDLLLAIKPDNYQAQVEQQEASLSSAKAVALQCRASLLKAQDDLRRNSDLFAKKLLSESDIATAQTALEVAQANLENAQAQIRRAEGSLTQARDSLAKTLIYSPIDGKVSSLSTEVGERVAGTGSYGGAEAMRVADLENMEVRVYINENDIVYVKVGDRAKVAIDAFPDRKFEGRVKEIGSAARVTGLNTQDEVTNFLVKIRIVDKDAPLRPGMSANADVETRSVQSVVAVPIQSVTVRSREGTRTVEEVAADRDKKTKENKGEGAAVAVSDKQQKQGEKSDRESLQRVVFVFGEDKVRMRKVETGLQDTTHIEIKSGVKEGEEVVSGSYGVITRTLKDETAVKLEKPKKPDDKR